MARSLFSSSWYRVAKLKPQLREHVEIHRQLFRGERWFIVEDHASGRFYRVSPEAYLLIGQLNGRRAVESIWEKAGEQLNEDLPTQDEVIQLLAQLYSADLLTTDVPPDFAELAERSTKLRRRQLLQQIRNPMAVRLPLFDPDRFLSATLWLVRPVFHPVGFFIWLALVLAAFVLAGTHWTELSSDVTDRVLSAQNIALMILVYPFVKALHELGHGYAAKAWGGEVHDMGLMFLVFMPVPYVDASSSSALRSKWRRAAVAAAGIMVELSLASIALQIWIAAEPGLVRAFAFNVMLIGGVSTLLFNGNPLLRYDGYYVFSDLIEVPNLATRANKYFFYIVQRYVLGVNDAEPGQMIDSERKWLFGYSIAAFAYRLLIMSVIILFVATSFFFIGVALAIWTVLFMFGLPAVKGAWFLLTSPVLRKCRPRALLTTAAAAAILLAAVAVVPVPYGTVVKGTVWVPDQAVIHASADGVIAEIVATPGEEVTAEAAVLSLSDPVIIAERRIAEAARDEYRLRLGAVEFADPVKADIVREQLLHSVARLDRLDRRVADLTVRTPAKGQLILPRADDLVGRFVRKGDLLGYVADPGSPIVRVAILQDDIDPVQKQLHGVAVRFAGEMSRALPATIRRAAPAASDTLSSMALSTEGGGDIPADPRERGRTLEKVFQLDLGVPATDRATLIGERVFVRFDHGSEPLAARLYRRIRQLFLSRFNV